MNGGAEAVAIAHTDGRAVAVHCGKRPAAMTTRRAASRSGLAPQSPPLRQQCRSVKG